MVDSNPKSRNRIWFWLIQLIGVMVPRRLRADWRQEWEAELRSREELLSEWDRLGPRGKLDLLRRSTSAFWDAVLLQPRRMEDEMIQDVRFGLRMLLKNPGFTMSAVLCLALGIGANTAIFSLASAVLLRPLEVAQSEQIVSIIRGDGMSGNTLSYPDYLVMREQREAFSDLAITSLTEMILSHGDQSRTVTGDLVSGNYFDLLGVRAAMGRTFLPEEDRVPGANPVVVLSEDFWRGQFGADPELVGKIITLNQQAFTVIGVAPKGFKGTNEPFAMSFWTPVAMIEQTRLNRRAPLSDRGFEFAAIGRLKPGVSFVQAQTQLETINRRLELANPLPAGRSHNTPAERALKVLPTEGIIVPFRPIAKIATILLSAVVGLVLLLACANVANLLLARASTRRKEIALRLALGAGRLRLLRQWLTESLLLALLGALVGLVVAFWTNRALAALNPPTPASWNFQLDLRLDWRTLGFTVVLTFATALLFGLAPAWQASKPDLIPALKDEMGFDARRRRLRWLNLRNALVVLQTAVSLVLLISAGLFLRSLQSAQGMDFGFNPENRLALSLHLIRQGYENDRGKAFIAKAVQRLATAPGVAAASAANTLPLGNLGIGDMATIEGGDPSSHNGQQIPVENQLIGLDYWAAMGTRLIRGREFTALDAAGAPPVAIINEDMARRYFPNGDPIGGRLRIGPPGAASVEIIGISRDVVFNLSGRTRPIVYRPLAQQPTTWVALIVKAAGESQSVAAEMRRVLQSIDPNLPVAEIKSIEEIISLQFWPARASAVLLGLFGSLGLLLAAVGLYGVMSYAVSERTREIGVRMALGADPRSLMRLMLRQGLVLSLVGAAIGVGTSLAVTRLLSGLLYGVTAADPITYLLVPIFLIGVALLACYLPARRATRIDPMIALRQD